MQNARQQVAPPMTGGGLSATALKMIAIVCMMVDHTAWAFVPAFSSLGIAMHFVGRVTGPVMFYCIVEGYHHTRNVKRYTQRLAVFAVVSYLPFIYFEYGGLPTLAGFYPFGIGYTMLLGLLVLRARHELTGGLQRVLAVMALLFASLLGDWAVWGVLYIAVFDMFRGSYRKQAAAGLALAMLQVLDGLMGAPALGMIQLGLVLPLILLGFYNGQRGRGGKADKWFFYVFYPASLLLLGFLSWTLPGLLGQG